MICKPFILKTSFLHFMWYTMVAYQIRVGAFKTYDHNLTVFHIVLLLGFYQIRVLTRYGCLPDTGAYQIRVLTKYGEVVSYSTSRITNHFWRRICFLVNIGVFTKLLVYFYQIGAVAPFLFAFF